MGKDYILGWICEGVICFLVRFMCNLLIQEFILYVCLNLFAYLQLSF